MATLHPFEGELLTINEIASRYTACSVETVRKMVKAGGKSVTDFNAYTAAAAAAKRKGSVKGSEVLEKRLGLRIPQPR